MAHRLLFFDAQSHGFFRGRTGGGRLNDHTILHCLCGFRAMFQHVFACFESLHGAPGSGGAPLQARGVGDRERVFVHAPPGDSSGATFQPGNRGGLFGNRVGAAQYGTRVVLVALVDDRNFLLTDARPPWQSHGCAPFR